MARVYGKRARTNRTYRLHIRLTEEEHLKLLAIAENCGKTLSDLIRSTVTQITDHSRVVKSLLSPVTLRRRISYALENHRNGTEQNSPNGQRMGRVHVSAEENLSRESAISRKTGHLAKCKCVECENLRSLFRLADGRPQAKTPKQRKPKLAQDGVTSND
jgi:hypothetical protein